MGLGFCFSGLREYGFRVVSYRLLGLNGLKLGSHFRKRFSSKVIGLELRAVAKEYPGQWDHRLVRSCNRRQNVRCLLRQNMLSV